jgi:SAM-dependent methyltransferase
MASMQPAAVDNWDQHWEIFGAAAEVGPTPKYRRRLIFRALDSIAGEGRGVRMLDIGSGTGEFAEEFCRRYPSSAFLGLELSAAGVELSRRRARLAKFVQRDLLQPAASKDGMDFAATDALCTEVLEHLEDPRVLLQNAAAYMAPGCRLVVTVPGGPMNAFYRHIGHRRHYSPVELTSLLEQSGFSVEKAYGAGFPFYNLFRLYMTMRGEAFIHAVAGEPSPIMRLAGKLLDALFHFNLTRWGWQTIAIARYKA